MSPFFAAATGAPTKPMSNPAESIVAAVTAPALRFTVAPSHCQRNLSLRGSADGVEGLAGTRQFTLAHPSGTNLGKDHLNEVSALI